MDKVLSYFGGDSMATDSWRGKYQMKDTQGNPVEDTPIEMHQRLAREFAKIEYSYSRKKIASLMSLSPFGRTFYKRRVQQSEQEIAAELFSYFDHFRYIVPQGSIMSNLGNKYVFGSLSNCFGIAPPSDSYSSICRADQELVQLMKRRGGVGTTLDLMRPYGSKVSNAAKTSSGAASFAERFSNSTREVAQEGRRGALMLLMNVKHPDIFRFIKMKEDRSKVTGANISVIFTDEFMSAVEAGMDFICRFPISDMGVNLTELMIEKLPYNKMMETDTYYKYVMKVKAKDIFDEFINMAWDNAEPGAAWIDRVVNYSPDGVYPDYKPELCNPCGEQWFHRYDTCRLIASNFFSLVTNPFTAAAKVDVEKLYEVFYIQQILGDDLVDLEAEYIDRILTKLYTEHEYAEIDEKVEINVEISLWEKIKDIALSGRRTGGGFTGLADMVAALGLRYDSDDALDIIGDCMKLKMEAELDATIDMAILRGTFDGWNMDLESKHSIHPAIRESNLQGNNDFYQMLCDVYPGQAQRMHRYGRRNVSWSTVAPTGTVSLMTQTTSGLEPLFKAFYIRRKKINPNDGDVRVDFTDQNGDKWQEYPVLHPKFKQWLATIIMRDTDFNYHQAIATADRYTKHDIEVAFTNSPWYKSEADDISWQQRIRIQAIIQKYTTNAISSTINLPSSVSKETVEAIYLSAWKEGLKGVTIYRDGSRTGVLITENKNVVKDKFGYTDATERPSILDAEFFNVVSNGKMYGIVVGLLDGNPYEVFAVSNPLSNRKLKGTIVKHAKGSYEFIGIDSLGTITMDNLQLGAEHSDEKVLTRFASMMLRHGVNPKFVAEQVEKSEVKITSFAKVIARVLKNYVPDEVTGEQCPECLEHSMAYQEGCKKCTNCGYSKC